MSCFIVIVLFFSALPCFLLLFFLLLIPSSGSSSDDCMTGIFGGKGTGVGGTVNREREGFDGKEPGRRRGLCKNQRLRVVETACCHTYRLPTTTHILLHIHIYHTTCINSDMRGNEIPQQDGERV